MKKQLLKETQIRRMMKYANIGALSNDFVQRLNEQDMMAGDEDEDAPEEDPSAMMGDEAPDAPDAEGDMDAEMDMSGEEGGAGDEVLEAVEDVVDGLKRALAAAGPEGQAAADAIFVEGGDEGAGEEDDGEGMGMEPPLGDAPEALGDAEDPAGMEGLEEITVVDEEEHLEEEMLQEVARRVARRVRMLKRRSETL